MGDHKVDKVEIFRDASNEWRWRAKSDNGNEVADSGEGYKNLEDAQNNVSDMFPKVTVVIVEDGTQED